MHFARFIGSLLKVASDSTLRDRSLAAVIEIVGKSNGLFRRGAQVSIALGRMGINLNAAEVPELGTI